VFLTLLLLLLALLLLLLPALLVLPLHRLTLRAHHLLLLLRALRRLLLLHGLTLRLSLTPLLEALLLLGGRALLAFVGGLRLTLLRLALAAGTLFGACGHSLTLGAFGTCGLRERVAGSCGALLFFPLTAARLLEAACERGVDFAGQLSGTRFVLLAQSDDWRLRADRVLAEFRDVLQEHVPRSALERGYFVSRGREGGRVRPLPRLAIGVIPVLPGVFDSRHEVLSHAKAAALAAAGGSGSALHVDERCANAYPRSYLLEAS